MKASIPQVTYKSRFPEIKGIEIIRLEDISKYRNESINHSPEKAHQIEFYKLVLYTEGETEHLVDFVWHKVQKNTLLYLSKGQVNAFKFKEGVKGYVILFTEVYFKDQLNKLPSDTIIRLFTSHLFSPKLEIPEYSNLMTYVTLFFEEFYKAGEVYAKRNIIDGLYRIIFSKIEQLKKKQTHYLKDSDKLLLFLNFQSLLKTEYVMHRNADYYAEQLNITYKHLNVVCKAIVKSTAKQYIDDFVILEAKRNLINSSIKSTELAYLMGFEESTNFVKYFKRLTGFTPNSFKKEHL